MIDLYTTCIIFTDMEFTNMKTGVSVVSGGRLFWYKQEPNEILWNKFTTYYIDYGWKKRTKLHFLVFHHSSEVDNMRSRYLEIFKHSEFSVSDTRNLPPVCLWIIIKVSGITIITYLKRKYFISLFDLK